MALASSSARCCVGTCRSLATTPTSWTFPRASSAPGCRTPAWTSFGTASKPEVGVGVHHRVLAACVFGGHRWLRRPVLDITVFSRVRCCCIRIRLCLCCRRCDGLPSIRVQRGLCADRAARRGDRARRGCGGAVCVGATLLSSQSGYVFGVDVLGARWWAANAVCFGLTKGVCCFVLWHQSDGRSWTRS